jgi:hypothetical protein
MAVNVARRYGGAMTQTTPANDGYNIDTPEGARRYVADWAPRLLGKTATYVQTNQDRLIHFRTMSDDDAIWVAHQLKAMEEEAHERRS